MSQSTAKPVYSIRLEPALMSRVDDFASKMEKSRTQVVDEALREHLGERATAASQMRRYMASQPQADDVLG